MCRALVFLPVLLLAPAIVSCSSTDTSYGYSRPYVPAVGLPANLDETELRLLPEIERVLEDAGYRVTQGRDADFDLDFSVDAGPINADVAMRLVRGRREVARAYARSGGARMLFRRPQVIRDAFEKCLHEFENQLPPATRADTGRSREGYDDNWNSRDRRDDFRRRENYDYPPSEPYDER
jgi:hypothetical protein